MKQGVDIMCFPEMSITGYVNPLQCPEAVLHLDGPEVARLLAMTREVPVTAIAGLVEENPQEKPFIRVAMRMTIASILLWPRKPEELVMKTISKSTLVFSRRMCII